MRIGVDADVCLEARWDRPASPVQAAVLCHPHPQHGGTMHNPLMRAVTTALAERGIAVLRFNFRGVGASTGSWSGGVGEIDDVAAAMAACRDACPDLGRGIAGWSFGAAAALEWVARSGEAVPYVGIAPPASRRFAPALPEAGDLPDAPRTFIIGDRDQYTAVDELQAYAERIGSALRVIPGSDHFFHFRQERVADLVAEGLLE